VQAIGGVNEKIEGFFDICTTRGLTGKQGVIIPQANVKDLMLRHDVRQAASEGRFHLYAVQHADEAMELLSGLPAGVANADGSYPEQTFNHLIQLRLLEWIALRQQFSASSA
jgi:predicted ATP-dependent protease